LKKVFVILRGGLGNQLFTYSIARAISIKNNSELIIDNKTGFIRDIIYQRTYQLCHFCVGGRIRTFIFNSIKFIHFYNYLLLIINYFLSPSLKFYVRQRELDFNGSILDIKFHKYLILDGYWQSESYFKDFEPIIREDLKFRCHFNILNLNMANKIKNSNSVALHVRFFESDINIQGSFVSPDYYSKAIEILQSQFNDLHYFIFSENPITASSMISLPKSMYTIVSINDSTHAHFDLWLMSKCNHFITANSTFSWWGAWLAKNPQKIVICPGFSSYTGVAGWGFKGLIPDGWKIL
jgi:hypothetical protein